MKIRSSWVHLGALVAALAGVLVAAPHTQAASIIYMVGVDGSNNVAVRAAPLVNGATWSTLDTSITAGGQAYSAGISVDPVAQEIVWGSQGLATNNFSFIKLGSLSSTGLSLTGGSGSGTTVYTETGGLGGAKVMGLTMAGSGASRTVYWTNATDTGNVSVKSGPLPPRSTALTATATSGGSVSSARDITYDAVSNHVYFIQDFSGQIHDWNGVNGTASTMKYQEQYWTGATCLTNETGPANTQTSGLKNVILNATGTSFYWSRLQSTGQCPALLPSPDWTRSALTSGGSGSASNWWTVDHANGLAIDSTDTPWFGTTSTVQNDFVGTIGATNATVYSLWIVESPVATSTPAIAGSATTGGVLTCGDVTWAADATGSRMSRQPTATRTYQWYRDGAAISDATTASHTTSAAGSYTCAVTAGNVAGTGTSSRSSAIAVTSGAAAASGSTPVAPGAPTGATATRSGSGKLTASWTAPSSNGGSAITGYTATATPTGKTCTSSGTSCSISGLTNGTSYTVTVTATNTVGTGSPSSASKAAYPYASITVAWKLSGRALTATFRPVTGAKSYTLSSAGVTRKSGTCKSTGSGSKRRISCKLTLKKGTSTLTVKAKNTAKQVISQATTSKTARRLPLLHH